MKKQLKLFIKNKKPKTFIQKSKRAVKSFKKRCFRELEHILYYDHSNPPEYYGLTVQIEHAKP